MEYGILNALKDFLLTSFNMSPIIQVKKISKKYRIGVIQPYVTLRDTIVQTLRKPLVSDLKEGMNKELQKEEFWALTDVSFSVERGEVIGIIGKNGAGKSTLLKILSRITPPTSGEIILQGRVASLLEVGTGFSSELTGRENIYLNGAILGMKQKEIAMKFSEIVEFAEIEKFLDTPVKYYSSGMYMRLAFAVAAHLEPDILIIDEVLAVGDLAFQKKCLGKMEEVSSKEGRTVLFISHNMGAISKLCTNTLLLDHGKVVAYGKTNTVIKKYVEENMRSETIYEQPKNTIKRMNLRKVFLNTTLKPTRNINYDEDIHIHIEYEINLKVTDSVVWVAVMTMEGTVVFCTADYDLHSSLRNERLPGYYHAEFIVPKKWLSPGMYSLDVGINSVSGLEIYDRRETIKMNIIDNGTTPKSLFNESTRGGIFQPFLDWKTTRQK